MAQPTPRELAEHREELAVIDSILPVIEALPNDGAVIPPLTSEGSERKRWAKKREEETAPKLVPPTA
jgi:hypothetical protein